jgi:hypothetical protein
MKKLFQIFKKSDWGLLINWKFHEQNRWVCAQTPYFINAIIREFNPIIISSQIEYELHKRKLRNIISMEPGWGVPKINYDKKQKHTIAVFVSDPHNKANWFCDYIDNNEIDFVFSYYYYPFLYHFPQFDRSKLIHMPWAIPDEFIIDPDSIINHNQNKIHIFGGSMSDAYDTRNWCRKFPFVEDHQNSGCENKIMSDEEYFRWGQQYDAIIAAGSLSEKYQLVTPKYFEIAAGGSLLFAQYCTDLALLGFDSTNCITFNRNNFEQHALDYLKNQDGYNDIRRNGCVLIKNRHKISNRIEKIKLIMQ